MHTTVPSWVDRVPQNLGAANHGSLKAAEWLILYKLYYTIALIPLWTKPDNGSDNEQERTRVSSLLQSTTLLSKIAQFLTLPMIKSKDLSELDDLLMSYRKCLQDNWPHEPSKPNLHLTQHYPEVILRFGPPRSTAAWAQERVNGILHEKIPTNCHCDKIPKTILTKWHVNSNFQILLDTQARDDQLHIAAGKEYNDKEEGIELDAPLLNRWKRAVAGKVTSRGKIGSDQPALSPNVVSQKAFEINRKRYTTCKSHKGNSLVEFFLGKDQRFGEIESIFISGQIEGKTWVIVKPFKEVQRNEDPYQEYPDLNCRLVRADWEAVVVIDTESIIGHAAMLKHQSGTFGITTETISAVGLGTSVSTA
ncbi:hypothetical protein PTTG_04201 [Puccinia triticina 1-1 BBBD Race 1]|uniref:Uncharacterized protein n=1 Tax=Puccinia triticina (isolate 1-1 / race 1 (BBBD)) TaxID=630390 RepID=A0A0C4ETS2_PUCT1|nr:hypothetical protein PTTG_04201 [Puccinia triticina 1-1 BBBD Race 1]